jgi:hypothetical protein
MCTIKTFGDVDARSFEQLKRCMAAGDADFGVLCADHHPGHSQPIAEDVHGRATTGTTAATRGGDLRPHRGDRRPVLRGSGGASLAPAEHCSKTLVGDHTVQRVARQLGAT